MDTKTPEQLEAEAQEKAAKDAEKAAAKAAEKAAKAAEKAAAKEAAAAEKEAAKAAKLAAKEAAEAEKAAAKAAKLAEKEAAKAAKEAAKNATKMPEQNGVRRPKPDGKCGQAWAIMDQLSAQTGAPALIKDVLVKAAEQGLNKANVQAEFARWRKFHGISGRTAKPAETTSQTEATSQAE